jgi:hypothetical protein
MSFGYHYTLARQDSANWRVRFPCVAQANMLAATAELAHTAAPASLVAALGGIMHADQAVPHESPHDAVGYFAPLPSLVTAKLTVYQRMHALGWTRTRLAHALGVHDNAIHRLLDLHHNSHLWVIDDALAKMQSSLFIGLPETVRQRAA